MALKAQFCLHYITFQFKIAGKNKNTARKQGYYNTQE